MFVPNNWLRSHHKFLHKSWLNFIFKISTKPQIHNLNQTLVQKYWPNLASESWPRINFVTSTSSKILTKLQLQNLDQTLCSKFEQKFSFVSKPQLLICNKLSPTRSSSSTSATAATSKSFELVSALARVTSIKFTKQQWVSEWVS